METDAGLGARLAVTMASVGDVLSVDSAARLTAGHRHNRTKIQADAIVVQKGGRPTFCCCLLAIGRLQLVLLLFSFLVG